MKNTLKSILSGVAAITMFASVQSEASQITITSVPGHSAGNGGEFLITPDASLSYLLSGYAPVATLNGGFFSFCIEYNEHISPPATYDAAISNGSISGGVSGAVSGTDIISNGTAWLYKQFAKGTLAGYDYTYGNRTTAAALQAAIWYLEGEIATISAGNIFYNAAVAQFGASTAVANNNGVSGVKALNLGTSPLYAKQDQLVYIPGVPDNGWTVALLGFGMLALFAIKRKTAKA